MTWGGYTTAIVGTSANTASIAKWSLVTFTAAFATFNVTIISYYDGIIDTTGTAEDVTTFGAFVDQLTDYSFFIGCSMSRTATALTFSSYRGHIWSF
jgi:hypothetical protein